MWWKFRRHRIAMVAGIILLAFYASTLISEFIAPYDLHTRDTNHIYAPPQALHCSTKGASSGRSSTATMRLNMQTLKREYVDRPERGVRLALLLPGRQYEFWA